MRVVTLLPAATEETQTADLLGSVPVSIIDGNAYTSRPGPRVVDGADSIHAAIIGRPTGVSRWHRALR